MIQSFRRTAVALSPGPVIGALLPGTAARKAAQQQKHKQQHRQLLSDKHTHSFFPENLGTGWESTLFQPAQFSDNDSSNLL